MHFLLSSNSGAYLEETKPLMLLPSCAEIIAKVEDALGSISQEVFDNMNSSNDDHAAQSL